MQLPSELWIGIASQLLINSGSVDPSSLISLAQCSQAFQSIAEEKLYESPVLSSSAQLTSFLLALLARSQRAGYVRDAVMKWQDAPSESTFCESRLRLGNLRRAYAEVLGAQFGIDVMGEERRWNGKTIFYELGNPANTHFFKVLLGIAVILRRPGKLTLASLQHALGMKFVMIYMPHLNPAASHPSLFSFFFWYPLHIVSPFMVPAYTAGSAKRFTSHPSASPHRTLAQTNSALSVHCIPCQLSFRTVCPRDRWSRVFFSRVFKHSIYPGRQEQTGISSGLPLHSRVMHISPP